MSSATDFDEEAARRDYRAPYSHNHPIPTVQKYREHRSELDDNYKQAEEAQHTEEDNSRLKRAFHSAKTAFKDGDDTHAAGDPYPTSNRNTDSSDRTPADHDSGIPSVPSAETGQGKSGKKNGDPKHGKGESSATEEAAAHADPKKKRKAMKHNKRDDGGREVTDPVTHLPLVIRDSTEKDLKRASENEPAPGSNQRSATGFSQSSKSSSRLQKEQDELQDDFDGMRKMFPPPAFDDTRDELSRTYQSALTTALSIIVGLSAVVISLLLFMVSTSGSEHGRNSSWRYLVLIMVTLFVSVIGFAVIILVRGWLAKKVQAIWEDEVWEAARADEQKSTQSGARLPESVAWMNSLLASVWPLINPDLFTSLADMLEDVMQASLPKVIRMVSVDDLGQGSEAIRVLGVRWLPTGAADQSVDEEGNIKKTSNEEANDRGAPGEGQEEKLESKARDDDDPEGSKKSEQQKKQTEGEQEAMREGMEAEQGDFVNMELAFAYRARSSGKTIKSKAKNAHLYLKFYLPGGIFVPVWVELRGIIGTMRLRMQLTPDPPFISLCTLTFLGQPRADLSCVPLSRHLPNLMNVPLISSFVQSSIDAALAEYVAPKSLTLNVQEMLVGDDFKKDTVARGIILIYIKEARGFKEGDAGIGPFDGSSDAYVTCSWGKFGKTISSTRIIEKDQNPKWHEWAYLLVSPEELNAEEKLRLQLWDSDKYTADDDLGRVEVDLKELMHNSKTKNQLCDREDRLKGQDPSENMPGTISWSVGYYSKTRITEDQLVTQTEDNGIKTKEDLKKQVAETAEGKLREASAQDKSKEVNQQKTQDYKNRENALICSSPPDQKFLSGILSIQIHNITGLAVESPQKKDHDHTADREDQAEQSDDLPSSYCTIILNHKQIYMTRTKPKNAKPFFNAGREYFIRDWQNAEIMVSCRDSRERENDALLGIVYLPLAKVFEKRSQVMDMYPLVGGMGFGRVRISMVFRSIELQLPKELRGWDYGTLELKSPVRPKPGLPQDLIGHRIKLRSNMTRVKMHPSNGEWRPKRKDDSVFLPCRQRYAMALVVEFRKSSLGPDSTPAFAVFWLKDIPDEEERTITMQVWAGGKDNLKRATTCTGYQGMEADDKPLGEIEVTMKFWRGLSGYHKKYAQKDRSGNMQNVMEVLDTVNDEIQSDSETDDGSDSNSDDSDSEKKGSEKSTSKKLAMHTNQSDSDSDLHHDSDDAGSSKNPLKKIKKLKSQVMDGHNHPDDGTRGAIGMMRDYKDHHRQLHRKHKGLMQWRGARTADWALSKVRHAKGSVEGLFEHSEKKPGVETEV
ncbi:Meiotically up-regulated protein 190 protein [Lachnellula occidentalis]|uniref:Meiotically up-regulated protein 190 protein n=1 Tax=Lachnellula occidentalis TaxID=215460 RepID=A0A8H8S0D8_9HELO|nr:Meiotically up-regulated protein 190 protein [Lachnellula occidentalis]